MGEPFIADGPDTQNVILTPIRRNSRAKTGRRVVVSLVILAATSGAAYAAMRIFHQEAQRTGSEKSLNLHLYAPYGSLAVVPGTSSDVVARLEMETNESDEDPPMYMRYGVAQNGVGNLRISVGTDEGSLHSSPPVAMWHTNASPIFSTANYIASDNGAGFFYGLGARYSMPSAVPVAPPNQQGNGYKSRLFLSRDIPIFMNAQLGFGESFMDLTGLQLARCYIETGASKVRIATNAPNSTMMSLYQVSAGVGECSLTGIGNSNATRFMFEGGIGYYSLDFSGLLKRSMDATISVGLGKVSISVPPQSARVQVFYDDNLFSGYNFSGLAIRRPGYATSVGFERSNAPTLTLHLSSGMGKMNVVYR